MARWLAAMLLGAGLLCSPALRAQSEGDAVPVPGDHEMQVWLAESHVLPSLSSGKNAELLEVGGFYGWVLTRPLGFGPMRGELEYAVDFIPLLLPFQSSGVTYGMAITPISLKWNFEQHRSFLLYLEGDGGGQRTLAPVPPDGTHINFTADGAVGVQILRGGHVWSIDIDFHHISDAHILPDDPTYNSIQLRAGFGIFTRRRFPF